MELYAWNRLKEKRHTCRGWLLDFFVLLLMLWQLSTFLFVCFCLRLAQFLRWWKDGLLYVRMKCEIPEQRWKLKRKHCRGDICCVGCCCLWDPFWVSIPCSFLHWTVAMLLKYCLLFCTTPELVGQERLCSWWKLVWEISNWRLNYIHCEFMEQIYYWYECV